ncbi:MAG: winged helix-turn-helix transcriptional regulator [Candidatus Bipolaricaulia bacterium]
MTYKNLDLEIIQKFREDGRASLRQIAKELDISTTTVSNRLKEMEERGVIRGFKPDIDYTQFGYSLTAITQIKARGTEIPKIVEILRQDENLTHVYEITGEFDILVIGKFLDEAMMNREIKRLLSNPMIEGTNTSVVLSAVKENADINLAPVTANTWGG